MSLANQGASAVGDPVQNRRGCLKDGLLIGLIWLASVLLVNPIGNFPLNDDWSFAKSVKGLIETGDFRPTGWTGMTLITQSLWGALFCLPTGFSFNALRLSTLLMSLCGIIATYLAIRHVHPSRLLAFIASLTVAFNPIYFALSNTFMTDVTFTALNTAAAVFFFGNLRNGSKASLIWATIFALAATMCRQPGAAVPLAYMVCALWMQKVTPRSFLRALAPLLLCVGGVLLFQLWLRQTGRLPSLYFQKTDNLLATLRHPTKLLPSLAQHFGIAALYLGCFSLPVLVLALPTIRGRQKSRRVRTIAITAGAMFVLVAIVGLLVIRRMMPTTGNILIAQGIGPLTLADAYFTNSPPVPSLGKSFWLCITGLSILGGAILVAALPHTAVRLVTTIRAAKTSCDLRENFFFLICAVIYLFPIMSLGGWDRYYLPGLPFLLIWIAALVPQISGIRSRLLTVISTLVIASFAFFSVCTTRDYLAWNRTRWKALRELMAGGTVSPSEVDGGFEFNGWYLYDPTYEQKAGKSWWWVQKNSFIVTFGELPGYVMIREYKFTRWLPTGSGRILVLKSLTP